MLKDILTIVIPCKNEGINIYDCLGLICKQSDIEGTNVVIADSSDDADSLYWLSRARIDFGLSIVIHTINGGYPAKARLNGSQLVKTLNEKGYWNIRTTSFGRDLPSSINNINNIEHFKGDLRDAEFCEMVTKDVDVIFHLAANTSNALDTKFNPLLHVTPNIEMNVNLMEQAWRNSVKKFVFISSNTTYPDMGSEFCTEDINVHATPMLPVYKAVGGMKRYGEMLCDFFSNQIHNPMQCVIIRPSNAFGPNDKYDYEKCHVTPANIRKVADGLNPIPVWGDGTEVRDLLHVEDMADGFIFVAENNNTYDIFNVCYGEGFTVNETLETIKELDGNTNPIEYVNNKAPMIPIRLLSSKKINDLGWKPSLQFEEGLAKTVDWYLQNEDWLNNVTSGNYQNYYAKQYDHR